MELEAAAAAARGERERGAARLGTLTHTTAMCWAAAESDVAMMQRLLDHGVDVNTADYDNRTPLHIAVSDNQERAVEFLLQRGAKTDVLDRWGRSPMDCAIENRNARMMQLLERANATMSATSSAAKAKLLQDGLDVLSLRANSPQELRRTRSSNDITALFRAVREGDTEKVKRVWLAGLQLDSVDDRRRTSLHVAVENAQLGVIELLLSADVETNVLDDQGRTPISIALEKRLFAIAEMLRAHQKAKTASLAGNAEIDQRYVVMSFTAAKKGDLNDLMRFVPDIVHPDAQDYDLRTLLHIASAEGHLEIAKYLVACGANVNLLDRWGTSPLSEAVDFAHNDVARFLMANHATESGNRAAIAVDHIDNATLNSALEYALRVVTTRRWIMGQVFCPMKDEHGACVLVAHSVWHRNDQLLPHRRQNLDVIKSNAPLSPTAASSLARGAAAAASASSTWNDPIQMFRKAGSLMMIDPGQGHTGRVFSGQHAEWLVLANTQQSQLFLLPHARRAGIQTIISVPMIYKMSTIAVLSWYSNDHISEDPEELQRIQRLLRSITILATLREELLSVPGTHNAPLHITRYQYCQSLDNAISANGDLLDSRVTKVDVEMADTLPLALEWGLFDFVDKLATSMSSEDHVAVISLLKSLVTLLRNDVFEGVFEETTQQERDEPQENIIDSCGGNIRTRWSLLVHLRYYLMYLHAVSPTEGTVFMDVDALVPTISRYFAGETIARSPPSPGCDPPQPAAEPIPSASAEQECVLCKFNVPGHIHPGRAPIPAQPQPKKPVFTSTSPYAIGENFFGSPGNPRSPVLREIDQALSKMETEYDNFERKGALNDLVVDGFKSTVFTSSDLYDAIGAAHEMSSSRRSSFGTQAEVTADPRKRLLDTMNSIMQDTSCIITYDQLLQLHSCLLPSDNSQGGVIRTTAAVGYASPRIYRVFLPVGEISTALRELVAAINARDKWSQRPLLCAYYAFAILVFFIHPFHDGNGRCARLLCNLIAKKLGFPAIVRAADKTIQVAEFLHRAIVTMEIITNSRRQNRQTRMLSTRKENSSMWF